MAAPGAITFWGWVATFEGEGVSPAFEKRWITTDGMSIQDTGRTKPDAYDYTGVVVPTFEDAHCHLADRRLAVPPGSLMPAVVAPPDGLKHKYLKEAPREEVVGSIREGLEDLVGCGVTRAHEFREGGIEGVRAFREAFAKLGAAKRGYLAPVVLGRPGSPGARPEDEKAFFQKMRRLLAICDGIGLSGMSDGDPLWNAEVVRFARREGKRVEVHMSESKREDVRSALEAGVQQLVHMVAATPDDLKEVANRAAQVAVCTRSNEFFGLRAPVEEMVRQHVDIRIGTDNAFLGPPDMFEEARAFARVHKAKSGLKPAEILSFLFARKDINGGRAIGPLEATRPDFLIITIQTERPERDLIAKAKRDDVAAVVGAHGGLG